MGNFEALLKKTSGKISSKFPNVSENTKAPKGRFFIDNNEYTCWNAELFGAFNVGDEVDVAYTESEWKNKINRNINKMVVSYGQMELPTEEQIDQAPIEEEVKVQATDIIHEEVGPDPNSYYIVLKGKKYRLMPI
jgi:hypothetical protein